MATLTLNQLNTEILTLKQDVSFLRSLFINFIGRDKEGGYDPKFIKEMRNAVTEAPEYSFQNTQSFLDQLKTV